jgi:hypothetical protein
MLLTTIIPTVGRDTLRQSVETALAQGLPIEEHEIVVVNNSGRPLPEAPWLKAPQVRIVDINCVGMSMSFNTGAAVAKGKWIHYLHDDDYLLPGSLQCIFETIQFISNDYDLVYAGLNRVDWDGNILSIDLAPKTVTGNIFALVVAQELMHPSVSFFRREAFLKTGGWHSGFTVRNDLYLVSQLLLFGNALHVHEVIACVRVDVRQSKGEWHRVREESREIRELVLDSQGSLARLMDSVRDNPERCGRAVRTISVSAGLNVIWLRWLTAVRRIGSAIWLSSLHFLSPAFWKGLTHDLRRREQLLEAKWRKLGQ